MGFLRLLYRFPLSTLIVATFAEDGVQGAKTVCHGAWWNEMHQIPPIRVQPPIFSYWAGTYHHWGGGAVKIQ